MKRNTVVYDACNSAFQMLKTQVLALTGASDFEGDRERGK